MTAILRILLCLCLFSPLVFAQPIEDLRDWRPQPGAIQTLKAVWQLDWLEPQRASQQVVLPFTWNDSVQRPWGRVGFGQLRLSTRLLLPQGTPPLALYIDDIKSAGRVWLDGELVAERGVPGSAHSEEARLTSLLVALPTDKEQVDVRIELSNYFHHEGGIDMAVRIAELKPLQLAGSRHQALYLLVTGAGLMMALLMGLLDRSPVRSLGGAPFAFLMLLASMRAAASGELLDTYLEWPALWVYRIEYLTGHLFAPAYGFLLLRLFPRELSWRPQWLLVLVGGVGALLTLWLPPAFFTLLRDPCALWLLLCQLYFLGALLLALKRRRAGALGILLGMLVMDATVVNDLSMYSLGVQTINLIPLGILTLLLSHGLVVGSRVLSALARNIELREDLQRLNASLEGRVEERTRALAVARDQALYEAQQTLERQAMLSHELRTPLVAIQGHLLLLDSAALPPAVQQRLQAVRGAAQSLTEVLDGLMLLSRAENMHLPAVSVFAPAALLEECAAIFRPQAEAKGLLLTVSCAANLPAFVEGVPPSLRQVLYNLLGNAIKFTEQGGIELFIEEQAQGLRLQVSDTGPGIAVELQAEVCNAFVRDGSAGQPGLGLGLYIVARLVELMAGRLVLDSAPGQGTRVEIWLPWPGCVEGVEDILDEPVWLHGLRVLLVEDIEVNRLVTVELLESWGCLVTAVDAGLTAVNVCTHEEFDLVLMDMRLPDIDGLSACQRIRERVQGRLPLLAALTANAADLDPQRCRDAGLVAVLAKPLRRKDLTRLFGDLERHLELAAPVPADISVERIEALRGWLGGTVFDRLLPTLLKSLTEVRAALVKLPGAVGAPEQLEHLCHRLRGSALNFGLTALAQEAERVQRLEQLPALLAMLDCQLDLLHEWQSAANAQMSAASGTMPPH